MDNYELINLDDYIQSGEGGMALTYSHKDGKTLAKLFMKGMGAEYELIPNKRSFARIISQEPEQLEPLSLRFAQLTREIHQTPADTTCLHGDLHIGNIITDGERTLWIDVGDFAYGAPEWDLCMIRRNLGM